VAVPVAAGQSFTLPPNAWNGAPLSLVQQITAQQADRPPVVFQAAVSLAVSGSHVTILDDLGRRAATITWGPQAITFERAPWLPEAVDLRRVLVDMMLVYWPVDALRAALPSGWRLTTNAQGRSITDGASGTELIALTTPVNDPWQGAATLTQRQQHYRLTIQSQRLEP
jgi:hypothetical protein